MSAPDLPTVYSLVERESVDSTNAEARRLALEGEDAAPDGTVVWAREQTAGRGRRGRTWDSPPGNLYASFVLRPDVPLPEAAQLSFVAALAVFDAIGTCAEAGLIVTTKWPNDILIDGHKVAGILLEAEGGDAETPPDFVVLGVGVNVASHPQETEFPAGCLAQYGIQTTPEEMLEALCRQFLSAVRTWLDNDFDRIKQTWLYRCQGKGETITVRLANETLEGVFEDLDADGALLLRTETGVRKITAGDVFFAGV